MINPLDPPDIEAKRKAALSKVYRLLIEVAIRHEMAKREAEETESGIADEENHLIKPLTPS